MTQITSAFIICVWKLSNPMNFFQKVCIVVQSCSVLGSDCREANEQFPFAENPKDIQERRRSFVAVYVVHSMRSVFVSSFKKFLYLVLN
jgi:hypothetical protein